MGPVSRKVRQEEERKTKEADPLGVQLNEAKRPGCAFFFFRCECACVAEAMNNHPQACWLLLWSLVLRCGHVSDGAQEKREKCLCFVESRQQRFFMVRVWFLLIGKPSLYAVMRSRMSKSDG
jgi:hypothetical protein